MKIKTIDVYALEWLDRANGNSYFAGEVIINYGMKSAKSILMHLQYGYGIHYRDMGFAALIDAGIIKDAETYNNSVREALHQYCERKNIILRTTKKENCKKRDLMLY
jgi:hypothetical protein